MPDEKLKGKMIFDEPYVLVVSPCCEDVIKDEKKDDWPGINLSLEALTKTPMQEIPKGTGKCDFCGKDVETPGFKVKFIP